jgi:predicted regulator of Ras-like GTPase activity (Roadblock/LC7/MglB family)
MSIGDYHHRRLSNVNQELTEDEANNLAQYLGQIISHSELEALALVSRIGDRLAFSSVPGTQLHPDMLCSMAAVLLQAGTQTIEKIGYNKLLEVVLRGGNAFLVLSNAGRFFLVGASNKLSDMGKIVSVFRYYAKEISNTYPAIE